MSAQSQCTEALSLSSVTRLQVGRCAVAAAAQPLRANRSLGILETREICVLGKLNKERPGQIG